MFSKELIYALVHDFMPWRDGNSRSSILPRNSGCKFLIECPHAVCSINFGNY